MDTDNWDNGVYIIKDWNIIGREFNHGSEQANYDLLDFVLSINKTQPVKEQLKEEEIKEKIGELKEELMEDLEA